MSKNILDKFLEMDRTDQKRFAKIVNSLLEENIIPKKYDKKTINGLECFVLDYNDETKEITYCTKDTLSADIIKKYFTDKWYLADWNDRYVRYNSNIRNNKLEDSYIYGVLNEEFKNDKLKDLNIVGDVRCLTKEEVENLDDEHKILDDSYWTMTPYEDCEELKNGDFANVFAVSSSGYLYTSHVNIAYGVRPVFTLKTEKL